MLNIERKTGLRAIQFYSEADLKEVYQWDVTASISIEGRFATITCMGKSVMVGRGDWVIFGNSGPADFWMEANADFKKKYSICK